MGMMTPMVKTLLIVNTAVYLLLALAPDALSAVIVQQFGLVPSDFLGRLKVWQILSYLFIHNPYGLEHILFNMLSLWMFGTTIESVWGGQRFLRYYLACGAGAGVFVIALVAALLGFTGIAGAAAGVAKILFVVFLVLLIVSAVAAAVRGRPPV